MTNKEMFETANAVGTNEIKAVVRNRFLGWCRDRSVAPDNATSILTWWREEWKEED